MISDRTLWTGFGVLVMALIAVDLGVSYGKRERMTVKKALGWSAVWIGIAVIFGFVLWGLRGSASAMQFFTGYLLEKALSVDNLFVFMIIFTQFHVPETEQRRVLTWGIFGALILRGLMIFAGISLIHRYHFVLYVFGAFLVYTGIRTFFNKEDEEEMPMSEKWLVRWLERTLPLVSRYEGEKFFTREKGKRVVTMLFLVLVVVEISDLIFAVDSIPAILAVTDDAFIVFSSNVLAILGLRALFFAVVAMLEKLKYLHFGLGTILVLIGAKMLVGDFVKIPPVISLLVTLGVLTITVAVSLLAADEKEPTS
jgi:tellurite resistance protein TerC